MERLVKKFMNYPISGDNILAICNGKANIVINSQLGKYSNIDSILGKDGAAIIFYDKKDDDVGHWSCLFRKGKYLEFFDPYGLDIDGPLKFTGGRSYLTNLCLNSKYRITFNPYSIQKYSNNISTCGRFVGLRLLLRELDIHQFAKLFFDNKCYQPDFWVTILTMFCDD